MSILTILGVTARTAISDSPCDPPFVIYDVGDRPWKKPCSLTFAVSGSIGYRYPINADIDWDGRVGVMDFLAVLTGWGKSVEGLGDACWFNYAWEPAENPQRPGFGLGTWALAGCCIDEDVDGDGRVGITDLLEVLASWGRESGGPCQ